MSRIEDFIGGEGTFFFLRLMSGRRGALIGLAGARGGLCALWRGRLGLRIRLLTGCSWSKRRRRARAGLGER